MTPDEIEELERLRRKAIYEQRYSRVELIHMLAEAERERDELREWQKEAVHELEEFRRLSAPQSEIYERTTKLIAQVVQDDSDIEQYL